MTERVLEREAEEALLGAAASGLGQVLEVTPAAREEVGTEGLGAIGTPGDEVHDLSAPESSAGLGDANPDALAGHAAGDEKHVTPRARDGVGAEREGLHLGIDDLAGRDRGRLLPLTPIVHSGRF